MIREGGGNSVEKSVENRGLLSHLKGKPLSDREREVATLVSRGLSNKEIASILSLADGSVNQYVYRVFLKLGINNRTQLANLWKDQNASQSTDAGRTGPNLVRASDNR